MGTLKKYRFKMAWQNYRKGQVIEPPGLVRDWLLRNGYIVPVEEPAEPVEPAKAPPVETASSVSEPSSTLFAPAMVRKRPRAS